MKNKKEKWTYCYIAGFVGILSFVIGLRGNEVALARAGAGIVMLSGSFILLRVTQREEDEHLQVPIGILGVVSSIVGLYTLITVHDRVSDSFIWILVCFAVVGLIVCVAAILFFLVSLTEGDGSPTTEDRVDELERKVGKIEKKLSKR